MVLHPGPAPIRNPLVRLFPVMRSTMVVPLPLDEAFRRLVGPNEREWQVGTSGFFGNMRRYKPGWRWDTHSVDIDGPYGNKKTRLYTYGRLTMSPQGTILELSSRICDLHALLMVLPVLWLAVAPLIFMAGFATPLIFLVLMVPFFYGITAFNIHYEAGVIKDYCARRLSDDWSRVLF
ncbi:MAG TPA: hypothetical protein VD886_04310 [Herpetosiphonaceae bacterium]|nr:hypothetical protein [Herpetosiphonaceae bacterium]